jgi:hypothetical protein
MSVTPASNCNNATNWLQNPGNAPVPTNVTKSPKVSSNCWRASARITASLWTISEIRRDPVFQTRPRGDSMKVDSAVSQKMNIFMLENYTILLGWRLWRENGKLSVRLFDDNKW